MSVDQPTLSFGPRPTPYASYGDLDRLHTMQRPRSDEPAELSFIVATQVMVRMQAGSPRAQEQLAATLEGPSLYDDVLALLGRRGLPVPPEVLGRDLAAPYEAHPGVEKAWRIVYEEKDHHDLLRLAELLLDVAERVTRWRQRHYASVRRALGAKSGTGGSSGLAWLRESVDRDAFPELWSVRNEL